MSAQRKLSILTFVVIAFLAGILFTTAGANLIGGGDNIGTESLARVLDDQDANSPPVQPAPSIIQFENAFVEVAGRSTNPFRTSYDIRPERIPR